MESGKTYQNCLGKRSCEKSDAMKFFAITVLALVAAINAAPINVSDNNIGDVITVGIKGSIDIDNKMDQRLVNVMAAYINQQLGVVGGIPDAPNLPDFPIPEFPDIPSPFKITPDMITPELIEKVKGFLARQ